MNHLKLLYLKINNRYFISHIEFTCIVRCIPCMIIITLTNLICTIESEWWIALNREWTSLIICQQSTFEEKKCTFLGWFYPCLIVNMRNKRHFTNYTYKNGFSIRNNGVYSVWSYTVKPSLINTSLETNT